MTNRRTTPEEWKQVFLDECYEITMQITEDDALEAMYDQK